MTMEDDDPLVLVFIPPLVDVLRFAEQQQGRPLTEIEVIAARDAAVVMAVPYSAALKVGQARGYHDIDAENVWEEWTRVRRN